MGCDRRKQSLYLPPDILREARQAAAKQDRPLSWIIQRAVALALPTIKSWPTSAPHAAVDTQL